MVLLAVSVQHFAEVLSNGALAILLSHHVGVKDALLLIQIVAL